MQNVQNSTDQKLPVGPIILGGVNGVATGNIHETTNINYTGDRVPTRERQHRSAHQNVRRRDITRQHYHQQQQMAAQAAQ